MAHAGRGADGGRHRADREVSRFGLDARVHHDDMPKSAIFQYCPIGGQQWETGVTGGRDNQSISRVAVKPPRKPHAIDGDDGLDRRQNNPGKSHCRDDPRPDLPAERQAAFLGKHRDFPRRHGGHMNAVRSCGGGKDVPSVGAESVIVLHGPNEDMRINNDQRAAFQSPGSRTGANGSSKRRTEPRMAPTIDAGSCDLTGCNVATGLPRFVIVTGS